MNRPTEAGDPLVGSSAPVIIDLTVSEEYCGEPALERVRRAVDTLAPDATLEVIAPVADHAFAVTAWGRRAGLTVTRLHSDGPARILLSRGDQSG